MFELFFRIEKKKKTQLCAFFFRSLWLISHVLPFIIKKVSLFLLPWYYSNWPIPSHTLSPSLSLFLCSPSISVYPQLLCTPLVSYSMPSDCFIQIKLHWPSAHSQRAKHDRWTFEDALQLGAAQQWKQHTLCGRLSHVHKTEHSERESAPQSPQTRRHKAKEHLCCPWVQSDQWFDPFLSPETGRQCICSLHPHWLESRPPSCRSKPCRGKRWNCRPPPSATSTLT